MGACTREPRNGGCALAFMELDFRWWLRWWRAPPVYVQVYSTSSLRPWGAWRALGSRLLPPLALPLRLETCVRVFLPDKPTHLLLLTFLFVFSPLYPPGCSFNHCLLRISSVRYHTWGLGLMSLGVQRGVFELFILK